MLLGLLSGLLSGLLPGLLPGLRVRVGAAQLVRMELPFSPEALAGMRAEAEAGFAKRFLRKEMVGSLDVSVCAMPDTPPTDTDCDSSLCNKPPGDDTSDSCDSTDEEVMVDLDPEAAEMAPAVEPKQSPSGLFERLFEGLFERGSERPAAEQQLEDSDVYLNEHVLGFIEQFRMGKVTYQGKPPNLDYADTDLHVQGTDGKWLRVPPQCVLLPGNPLYGLSDESFAKQCTDVIDRCALSFGSKGFNVATILKIEGLEHAPYHAPGAFMSFQQDPRLLFKMELEEVEDFMSHLRELRKHALSDDEKRYPAIASSFLRDNVPEQPTRSEKKLLRRKGVWKLHAQYRKVVTDLYSKHPEAYAERASFRLNAATAMSTGWAVVGTYDPKTRDFKHNDHRESSLGADAQSSDAEKVPIEPDGNLDGGGEDARSTLRAKARQPSFIWCHSPTEASIFGSIPEAVHASRGSAAAEATSLRARLEKAEKDADASRAVAPKLLARLKEQKEAAAAEATSLRARLERAEKDADASRVVAPKLLARLKEQKEALKSQEESWVVMQAALARLKEEKEAAAAEATSLRARLERAEKDANEIEWLKHVIDLSQKRREELERESDKVGRLSYINECKLHKAERRIAELEGRTKGFEINEQRLSAQLADSIASLKAERTRTQSHIDEAAALQTSKDLVRLAADAEQRLKKAAAEADQRLKKAAMESDQRAAGLQVQLAEQVGDNGRLSKELGLVRRKLERAQGFCDRSVAEIQGFKAQMDAVRADRDQALAAADLARACARELQRKMHHEQVKLNAALAARPECVVCQEKDAPISHAYLECMHVAVCDECLDQNPSLATQCPCCNVPREMRRLYLNLGEDGSGS